MLNLLILEMKSDLKKIFYKNLFILQQFSDFYNLI